MRQPFSIVKAEVPQNYFVRVLHFLKYFVLILIGSAIITACLRHFDWRAYVFLLVIFLIAALANSVKEIYEISFTEDTLYVAYYKYFTLHTISVKSMEGVTISAKVSPFSKYGRKDLIIDFGNGVILRQEPSEWWDKKDIEDVIIAWNAKL